jgi:hypothetical protein
MSLPKISSPTFKAKLPSTGREVKYRPFTVKEEKILLMASQSNDTAAVVDSIKQIMTNCILDDIDVDKMATFDVEYLFIQLRSKSVDNIMQLKFVEDGHTYEVDIDLDDIEVTQGKEKGNHIALNDEVSIVMKYPSFEMIEKLQGSSQDDIVDVIANSIDKIVNGEEILELGDYTKAEVAAFIESFTSKNMRDIETFFQGMPKIKMDLVYTTVDGQKKTKEVSGLQNFFMQ